MKCLTPNCDNQGAVNCKGLCMAKCYPAAKKLVESGRTTWEKLAEMGLAQNKVEDAFMKAFEEKNNAKTN